MDETLAHPDAEAIEAGRLLFAGQCEFVAAANNLASLPPLSLPEVAFAGRSNVGKSSLINALTSRNNLARTSQTPGRTRQLIFFSLSGRLQLVDLPGYGYAKAPKTDIDGWTKLTRQFLAGRQTLQRLMLLIDSRRGINDADRQMMKLMDEQAVSWAVVLTKIDKLTAGQQNEMILKTSEQISKHVAAFPHIWTTSSADKTGIEALRAHIAGLTN